MNVLLLFASTSLASGLLFANIYTSLIDTKSWGAGIPQSVETAREYFKTVEPKRFFRMIAPANLAAALLVLCQVRGVWIVALAFAILYGWSNGVMTIVRGTVPAELFGHHDYGALLGRLAQPQFVAKAIAPLALTLVFVVDRSRIASSWALFACGLFALFAYRRAISRSAVRTADD